MSQSDESIARYTTRVAALRDLDPSYFALVKFFADARNPRRAFGFFTFGAAAGVLAAPLGVGGAVAAAALLLSLALAGWLLPSYIVPMLVGGEEELRPPLAGANGTWFLWVVSAQSVAVAATAFPAPVPSALAALGICCWVIGVVLYLVVSVLVVTARLEFPLRPADSTAPYWVFMGATAISVLAGSQILRLPIDPLAQAVHPVVSGLSVMLWAFGTWLIPLLVALGVWRHLLRHVSLGYEPALWAVVFPIRATLYLTLWSVWSDGWESSRWRGCYRPRVITHLGNQRIGKPAMPRENYCHNCRWWQPLTDGVHCSWCLTFFYQHGRMPTPTDR